MPIDVTAERRRTPGCAHTAYLNHAGSSLPTAQTLDAMVAHLGAEARIGGYAAATAAQPRLDVLHRSVAGLLGAVPEEVAVTGSDTQSWAKAFWGFVLGGGIVRGQRVLVDRIVYVSHYMAILQASRHVGFGIDVIESEPDGTLSLDALAAELARGDVALVTATHVGTHRGSVNPVAAVGAATAAAGVPYFLDACQSLGQRRVDVGEIGCDVLTATGRKWLRGPRGTGLLYVRSSFVDRLEPVGVDSRSAVWVDAERLELAPSALRFEEFEVPYAAQLGLAAALDHVGELGIDEIEHHVVAQAEQLRADLAAIERVSVVDGGRERSAIVTFVKDGSPPTDVVAAAAAADVTIGVSAAPYARLDMAATGRDEVVRVSPHYVNDAGDLGRLLEVVAAC